MKVEDLDVLRPEPRIIRIGEKDIDVSFVPCGITFEVDEIVQKMGTVNVETLNREESRKLFDLSIELCSLFCAHKYPELTKEWFFENTDVNQVAQFAEAIKGALSRAYNIGSEGGPKNLKAPKKIK